MIEMFGMGNDEFDFEIEDMEVSVLADGAFRVKEMNVKFIFDEKSAEISAPSFEFSTQYFNYNAVTPITDTLNPKDYTEIEDCRLMYDFADMLKALEEKKDGSFTVELEQTLSVPYLNQTQIYRERDAVVYGEKNGSYFYDITATTDSETVLISYANGMQTFSIAGQTQSLAQTADAAREYIGGLINTVKYSPEYVSLITKKADGVYEIQCNYPDAVAYEMIFETYAGEMTDILQIMTVTVENGGISKIESRTTAKGTASTGYQTIEMNIEVVSVNIFNQ